MSFLRLAGAQLLRAPLREREARNGMGSHSPLEDRGACTPGAERANHGAKRSYPCALNGQSRTPVPTIVRASASPNFPPKSLQSLRFYDILIAEITRKGESI